MRYYAIADLHGRYDLLIKAIKAIHDDTHTLSPVEDYKIITLGDYIDRGSASKDIISFLSSNQSEELISLKGNHEDMAVQTIVQKLATSWWFGNGGDKTLESYGSRWPHSLGWMPDEHVRWMAGLPQFYETEKHVFIHAGVPEDVNDLNAQDPERQLWMLYMKDDHGGYRGKHVVHGHHQFADGPHEWSERTDLDTFAWKTGRLVVGVFDDSQHKAIKFLEVLGDDYDHQRAGVE